MRNLFLILTICCSSISTLLAQPRQLLSNISNRLMTYNTYKTKCFYTFTFPSGDSVSIESSITIQKVEKDTVCGFYYCFITAEKNKELFGDFSLYFNGYSYNSYKDVIEKVANSSQNEIAGVKLNIPAKRKVLFDITPNQIANNVRALINDTNAVIIQLPDTLIDNQLSSFFKIYENKTNKIIELCFHKSELYPLFRRITINGTLVNQTCFSGTTINSILPSDYFSEENLLPVNWNKLTKVNKNSTPDIMLGKKAPDWKLPVLGQNKYLSLIDFRNQYVLLEFTATWCGVCNLAAKKMKKVEERFADNPNIKLLTIFSSEKDNTKSISLFVERNQIQSTILIGGKQLEEKYHTYGYPNYFLISPKGKVLIVFPGFSEGIEEYLINSINEFLKK